MPSQTTNHNPFYSEVDGFVKTCLDNRKSYYGDNWKSKGTHEWLLRKQPYLLIMSGDEPGLDGSGVSQLSMFDDRAWFGQPGLDSFEKTYGIWDSVENRYKMDPNGRNLPGAMLTGCTITNQGRYGSTRKATVKYTVFRRSDFNTYSNAFLVPRRPVTIHYGYANFRGVAGLNGTLNGYVYNFSWSLRTEDGGYDCSFDVLGPGAFGIGTDMHSSDTLAGVITLDPPPDDEEGTTVNFATYGARGRMLVDVKNMKQMINPAKITEDVEKGKGELFRAGSELVQWNRGDPGMLVGSCATPKRILTKAEGAGSKDYLHKPASRNDSAVIVAAALIPKGEKGYANEADKAYSTLKENMDLDEEDSLGAILKKGAYDYYINLDYIVNVLINIVIIEGGAGFQVGQNTSGFYFKCDSECSLSHLPTNFCTYDPSEVVIPGMWGDYTDSGGTGTNEIYFPVGDNMANSPIYRVSDHSDLAGPGRTMCFNKILFNVEIIDKIFDRFQKEDYLPVLKFLDAIFAEITTATGGAIKPACIIPDTKTSDGKQSSEIRIVDTNFAWSSVNGVPGTPISPYVLESFSKNSILKNVSMDLKLPSKLMTALYVGGTKSISGTNQRISNFFGLVGQQGTPAPGYTNPHTAPGSEHHAMNTLGVEKVYLVLLEKSKRTGSDHEDKPTDTYVYKWTYTIYKSEAYNYRKDGSHPLSGGRVEEQYRKKGTGNERGRSTVTTEYTDAQYLKASVEAMEESSNTTGEPLDKADTEMRIKTIKALENPQSDFISLKRLINEYGPTPYITKATGQLLRRLTIDGEASDKMPWNKKIPLPMGFKATLDGIEGFRFGNLVTTNWLPDNYYRSGTNPSVCFLVTNITHNITPSEWTTELATQCRIWPEKVS